MSQHPDSHKAVKQAVEPDNKTAVLKNKNSEKLNTLSKPWRKVGNACQIANWLPNQSVDLIVTSPPYWKKRNYGHADQLGQESTPQEFVTRLCDVLDSWQPVLKPTASVFINLGDSMRGGCLVGVTTLFELEAIQRGWKLISRLVWAKRNGIPNPHGRLAQRHEHIFQLARTNAPFTDTFAYSQEFSLSEGNIWHIDLRPTKDQHLAPFPEELPRRAILLACPERVCATCGTPLRRQTQRGLRLNPERSQARRALEIWSQSNLTERHLQAIRATGICDAGKSLRFQTGANANSIEVTRLAQEAKQVLGGYFREFTFALPEHAGWEECACRARVLPKKQENAFHAL